MGNSKQKKEKELTKEKSADEIENEEESSSDNESGIKIKPIGKKIGEPKDNLERREEWFQKRSGKK